MDKKLFYLVTTYPDGHGSIELTDENGKLIGLCALFGDKKAFHECFGDIFQSNLDGIKFVWRT